MRLAEGHGMYLATYDSERCNIFTQSMCMLRSSRWKLKAARIFGKLMNSDNEREFMLLTNHGGTEL
jgi:hypothetical protein